MDALLERLTSQAVSLAIRSGITITASYAIKQCTRVLKEAPVSKEREELVRLQQRLDSRIRILSPAIDLIELSAARGNTSLGSAVSLTQQIRREIQDFGAYFRDIIRDNPSLHGVNASKSTCHILEPLQLAIAHIQSLLIRIEEAIPLLNLAITTSGISSSTKLSSTISPSRLLQASTFVTAADAEYVIRSTRRQHVGPDFSVSLYMLFSGYANLGKGEGAARETTWKEVIHKAKVSLHRVPIDDLYTLPDTSCEVAEDDLPGIKVRAKHEFAYQLLIIEDLDDGRVHNLEDAGHSGRTNDVANVGMREVIPLQQVSRIFYADTGKILKLGGDDDVEASDSQSPVLLLRRDLNAESPRSWQEKSRYSNDERQSDINESMTASDHILQNGMNSQIEPDATPNTPYSDLPPAVQPSKLPANLDPEWLALEVYTGDDEGSVTDSEAEDDDEGSSEPRMAQDVSQYDSSPPTSALSRLKLERATTETDSYIPAATDKYLYHAKTAGLNGSCEQRPGQRSMKTTLSLLEMLLKLTALQQFRQESHLSIEDELLNFFLENSSTVPDGADQKSRHRLRQDAVRRLGFDPYDVSPKKRPSTNSPVVEKVKSEQVSAMGWEISSSNSSAVPHPRDKETSRLQMPPFEI